MYRSEVQEGVQTDSIESDWCSHEWLIKSWMNENDLRYQYDWTPNAPSTKYEHEPYLAGIEYQSIDP